MTQPNEYKKHDMRGGYRVPDGYFSDMTHLVVEKAQMAPADNSWSAALKRMLGFAGGFAFFVLLAMGMVYLIPQGGVDQNQTQQMNAQNGAATALTVEEFADLYNLTEDDILQYYFATDSIAEDAQFAEAVDNYLKTYGIDE